MGTGRSQTGAPPTGSANGGRAPQTIDVGSAPAAVVGFAAALKASASSGLPLTYSLVSGQATLVVPENGLVFSPAHGDLAVVSRVSYVGTATTALVAADTQPIVVQISQAGNDNFQPASATLTVTASATPTSVGGGLTPTLNPPARPITITPGETTTVTFSGANLLGGSGRISATVPAAFGLCAITDVTDTNLTLSLHADAGTAALTSTGTMTLVAASGQILEIPFGITITAPSGPALPPTSVAFNDALTEVEISFPASDYMATPATPDKFVTIGGSRAAFGVGATDVWDPVAKRVTVVLGRGATLALSSITATTPLFIPYVSRSALSPEQGCTYVGPIDLPAGGGTPTVTITGPTSVPVNAPATFYAAVKGVGAGTPVATWSHTAPGNVTSASYASATIAPSAAGLDTVRVSVTNFLGFTGNASLAVTVVPRGTLTANITGSATVSHSQAVVLLVAPSGGNGSDPITIAWTLPAGVTSLSGVNSSILRIGANTLHTGANTFVVNVTQAGQTAQASFTVTVAASPISLSLVGGSVVTTSSASTYTVTPLIVDPEAVGASSATVTYSVTAQGVGAVPVYTLAGNTLVFSAGRNDAGAYSVTATATTSDHRTATATQVVNIAPANVPRVSAASMSSGTVIAGTQMMRFFATVADGTGSSPYSFQWTLPLGVSSSGVQLHSPFLVLQPPNAGWTPGSYTVDVAVTDSNAQVARASATVTVAAPPTGGVFNVTPTTGTAFDTVFSASMTVLPATAYPPLVYQFYRIDPATGSKEALSAFGQSRSTFNSVFGGGDSKHALTIGVTVYDALGGSADYQRTITVNPPVSVTHDAPTLTGVFIDGVTPVSPAVGPTTGGTPLLVTGTNLADATSVTIAGINATFKAVLGGLAIVTPAGNTGSADLVVTTAAGTVTVRNAFSYTALSSAALFGSFTAKTTSGVRNGPRAFADLAPAIAGKMNAAGTGGRLIGYIDSLHAGFVVDFTLDAHGAFEARTNTLAPQAEQSRPLTFEGSLVGMTLSGWILELGLPFTLDAESASGPGSSNVYASSDTAAAATEYVVVGSQGKVFVLVAAPGVVSGGAGAIDGGKFNVQGANGIAIDGVLDDRSAAVNGTITTQTGLTNFSVPAVRAAAPDSQFINVSGRAFVARSRPLVLGLAVDGAATKPVLLRALGPSLAAFGLTPVLAKPALTLQRGSGETVAANAGWAGDPVLAATMAQAGAFGLGGSTSDSAAALTLNPGVYTMTVSDSAADNGGIAMGEIYDAGSAPGTTVGRILNVSCLGAVGAGNRALVLGFVLAGNTPKNVLVRAVGPTLTTFGVGGVIADPVLSVYDASGGLVDRNAGWYTTTQLAGAFPLPAGTKDDAMTLVLAPGAYTAVVTSASGGAGTCLIEAYELR